ncbi:unnamed protein product [Hapterophycus canaliculatus]
MDGCTTHLVQAGANILSNGDCGQFSGGTPQSSGSVSPSSVRGRGQDHAGGVRQNASSSLPPVRMSPDSGPMNLTLSGQGRTCALSRYSSPEWREYWDEEVEASYYYNSITREARWVRPEEL